MAVQELYKVTGVLIRRFDFSDAQSGKGPCDRMAAVTKSNIRRFICEKNDCVTSSDFVQAAKSTRHMTIRSCRLSNSIVANRSKWQGIHNFNNIQYELASKRPQRRPKLEDKEINIRVWRAFGVGAGQQFQWSKMNVSKNNVVPLETSLQHDNDRWQKNSLEEGNL